MPPLPRDPAEAQRVEHTRFRRRVLYSMHAQDVRTRLIRSIGSTRTGAWGEPDMTSNPAWYTMSQLAALYREIPEVTPPAGGEDVAAAVAEAGWWQLAQRNQRDCIGLNDHFVHVRLDDDGAPTFRLVPPDMVEVAASPLSPAQPYCIKEWMRDPDDTQRWVQVTTDARSRSMFALDASGVDVTERVLGSSSLSGDAYPYIVAGKPVLPYIAYHAAASGYALDPYSGREVFEGTIQLGVFYSFFAHILRNAAWGQRWILNAQPAGGDMDESGRRKEVISDPATLLVLQQLEEGGTAPAQVGQFSPSIDPDKILGSIERYERRLTEMALSNVGVSRRESDVRSAMSLAVSRESQREAQRAYEPMFRRSDIHLLQLVAGLMGAPTDGWRIVYKSLPRDPAELQAEMVLLNEKMDAGLLDKVSAYQQLHPGMTVAEARSAVAEIARVNASLAPAPSIPAPFIPPMPGASP